MIPQKSSCLLFSVDQSQCSIITCKTCLFQKQKPVTNIKETFQHISSLCHLDASPGCCLSHLYLQTVKCNARFIAIICDSIIRSESGLFENYMYTYSVFNEICLALDASDGLNVIIQTVS